VEEGPGLETGISFALEEIREPPKGANGHLKRIAQGLDRSSGLVVKGRGIYYKGVE